MPGDNSFSILSFKQFSSSNYLCINKDLLKVYGAESAIFISNLIDKFLYFYDNEKLVDGYWFFQTHEKQISQTGLSEYALRKQKKLFQESEILEVKMYGLPAKEVYKINIDALMKDIELQLQEATTQEIAKRQGTALAFSQGHVYKETLYKETQETSLKEVFGGTDVPPSFSNFKNETKTSRRKAIPRETIEPKEEFSVAWINTGWKKTILDLWNQMSETTTHKDVTSKTICRAAKWLEYLKRGIFFKHCKLSARFIEKNKIPNSWFTKGKSFTQREIFIAFSKYPLLFQKGYWPIDKTVLAKSIDVFIYNEYIGSSLLLTILAEGEIIPLIEKRRNKDKNPQYTKYFKERGLLRDFRDDEMPNVRRGISAIETRILAGDFFDFDSRLNLKVRTMIGTKVPGGLTPMFENYAIYLKNQNRLDKDKVFSSFGYFDDFLKEIKSQYKSLR